MSALSYLGNGNGLLYVVANDGTTILQSVPNNESGVSRIRQIGSYVSAIGTNRSSYGIIEVTSVDALGDEISNIQVKSINVISSVITIAASSTVSDVALQISNAINSYTPTSGDRYVAFNSGGRVFLFAPQSSGDSPNGNKIVVSNAGSSTFDITNFEGGTTASTNIYDGLIGRRFFINANFDASGCSCGDEANADSLTNAIEITDAIIVSGINSAPQREEKSITSSGFISITSRKSSIVSLTAGTNGRIVTDDLDSIYYNASDGDILFLKEEEGNTITVRHNQGNIRLSGAANKTINKNNYDAIILQYNAVDAVWEEISGKSSMPSASIARSAGQPWLTPTLYGTSTIAPANNTTVTLTANTDYKYVTISGTTTLTSGNYAVNISTTDAIKGDTFYIRYNGNVTIGSYQVTIGGKALSAHEALVGGLLIEAIYNGSTWDIDIVYSYDSGYTVTTSDIADDAVTVAKVENNLTYEVITVPVSFESGEQCDNKVKIPYAGTVTEIYAIVTKALSGTDAGTITPKNNAGTTMTDGVVTFSASAALNTAQTTTPSANNTVAAGDIISLTTAKSTVGGKALVSIKITRS